MAREGGREREGKRGGGREKEREGERTEGGRKRGGVERERERDAICVCDCFSKT